jgi:hypothetical protein
MLFFPKFHSYTNLYRAPEEKEIKASLFEIMHLIYCTTSIEVFALEDLVSASSATRGHYQ